MRADRGARFEAVSLRPARRPGRQQVHHYGEPQRNQQSFHHGLPPPAFALRATVGKSTILVPDMHVAAIIAAGGRGVRFGADRPKQFLDIGGRSILELSVAALAASDRIHEIVVALPDDHVDAGGKALREAIEPPGCRRRRRRSPPGFGGERVRESVEGRRHRADSRRRASVRDAAT